MIAHASQLPTLHAPEPESSSPLLQIRELIYNTAGLFQTGARLQILEDRCRRRMLTLGIRTLQEYCDCLTSKPMSRGELTSLLDEITVGETCFHRNQAQLDGIREVILPRLLQAKSSKLDRSLRIWSAGCSTGEEPYTLAIALLEERNERLSGWNIDILATDLNQRSIETAIDAAYHEPSLRNITPQLREKYFHFEEKTAHVSPQVRELVRFRQLNLFDDCAMETIRRIDIILCCNVLIYFDLASKKRVIQHFYSSLTDDGYLLLGQAESLFRVSDQFQLVHLPSATAYRAIRRQR
jgi:chemotaxis protein methyltransferase CheR